MSLVLVSANRLDIALLTLFQVAHQCLGANKVATREADNWQRKLVLSDQIFNGLVLQVNKAGQDCDGN